MSHKRHPREYPHCTAQMRRERFALSLVCQGAIPVRILPPASRSAHVAGPNNHNILKVLDFLRPPLYFVPEGVQGQHLHPFFIRC